MPEILEKSSFFAYIESKYVVYFSVTVTLKGAAKCISILQ